MKIFFTRESVFKKANRYICVVRKLYVLRHTIQNLGGITFSVKKRLCLKKCLVTKYYAMMKRAFKTSLNGLVAIIWCGQISTKSGYVFRTLSFWLQNNQQVTTELLLRDGSGNEINSFMLEWESFQGHIQDLEEPQL